MIFSVLVFSILCQQGSGARLNKYDRVMEILKTQGPSACEEAVYAEGDADLYKFGQNMATVEGRLDDAIIYFVNMARHKKDPVFYFGKAWVHWQKQEVGYAQEDVIKLINSDANALLKARSHYLLGNIRMQNHDIDEAFESAEESEKLYQLLGKNGGLYLANILKAAIEIKREDYESGIKAIEAAERYNKKIKNPYPKGRSYELFAEIYFQQADYEKAISYSNLAKDDYFRSNQDQNAWGMTTRIGLCYALLGKYGRAHTITLEVDAFSKGKKFDRIKIYNYLTIMFLDRCKGLDYQARRSEILNWINHQSAKSPLRGLFSFVENVSCN